MIGAQLVQVAPSRIDRVREPGKGSLDVTGAGPRARSVVHDPRVGSLRVLLHNLLTDDRRVTEIARGGQISASRNASRLRAAEAKR